MVYFGSRFFSLYLCHCWTFKPFELFRVIFFAILGDLFLVSLDHFLVKFVPLVTLACLRNVLGIKEDSMIGADAAYC